MPDGNRKPDEESEKDDSGKINGLQIAAATGAATTAAVVANVLGIYGTVVGVAVFSVISSVGTVVYLKSMNHTKKKIDKVVKNRNTVVMRSRAPGGQTTPVVTATQPLTKAIGTAKVGAVPETVAETPSLGARTKEFLKRNWRSLAVSSLVVFVLTVGLLTSISMLSGQPATSFYDTGPQPTSDSRQPGPTGDQDGTGEQGSTQDEKPSGGDSPSSESQPPKTSEAPPSEAEPSTKDSEDEDSDERDGDLKPTPSGGGADASNR